MVIGWEDRLLTTYTLSIHSLIKKAFNQEIYCTSIELKKAYDTVSQVKLWTPLEKSNTSINLMKAIKFIQKYKGHKKGKISKGFVGKLRFKRGMLLICNAI